MTDVTGSAGAWAASLVFHPQPLRKALKILPLFRAIHGNTALSIPECGHD